MVFVRVVITMMEMSARSVSNVARVKSVGTKKIVTNASLVLLSVAASFCAGIVLKKNMREESSVLFSNWFEEKHAINKTCLFQINLKRKTYFSYCLFFVFKSI